MRIAKGNHGHLQNRKSKTENTGYRHKSLCPQWVSDSNHNRNRQRGEGAEASIYEYFSTSERVLFSIPACSSRGLFDIMAFHLKPIRGAGDKLRAIVYLLMDSYQNLSDFAGPVPTFPIIQGG